MKPNKNLILTINGGSSSIKFAAFDINTSITRAFYGAIERIGMNTATISFNDIIAHQNYNVPIIVANQQEAANYLLDWLEDKIDFTSVTAIGNRIVHGMEHTEPEPITPVLIIKLKKISGFDPEHMPAEIRLIEAFGKRYPSIVQVACFDTSFHRTIPPVARLLTIPRRFNSLGIKRYGFHGLSYAFIMEELRKTADLSTAQGRIILAHLGNGASLAAVKEGKSIDTTMGFTPTSGLPMGTRSGDLDPGAACYIMESEKMSAAQFSHLINHESGLLGISETSSDMQELLRIQGNDIRAAEAIELFCYQTRKWIGAFSAVLGGLDTLIFTGGIGEHAPEVRSNICKGLLFLGVEVEETKNINNEPIISKDLSRVTVRVIPTNEEVMIVRQVCRVLNYSVKN